MMRMGRWRTDGEFCQEVVGCWVEGFFNNDCGEKGMAKEALCAFFFVFLQFQNPAHYGNRRR